MRFVPEVALGARLYTNPQHAQAVNRALDSPGRRALIAVR